MDRGVWQATIHGFAKSQAQSNNSAVYICCLVTKSCPTHMTHQAPLSKGFPRQEYWSGLPFPSPEVLTNQRIKSMSPPLAGRFLTISHEGRQHVCIMCVHIHIYTYVHIHIYADQFAVEPKLTQYCKSTILRFFKLYYKNDRMTITFNSETLGSYVSSKLQPTSTHLRLSRSLSY